jgi:hypothetical protein
MGSGSMTAIKESISSDRRRKKKWTVGKEISNDGNVFRSPGLQPLIQLQDLVD